MISVDIKDHPKIFALISEELKEAASKAAVSAAARAVSHITQVLIPNENPVPVFDSHYQSAWQFEKTERGADVYNTMPYASVIEYGARGDNIKIGRAMITALTEWVRRKGIAGKSLGIKGKRGRANTPDINKEAESIAWAIAVSMKKKGIFNRNGQEGLRIAERASKKMVEFFEEDFREFLAKK